MSSRLPTQLELREPIVSVLIDNPQVYATDQCRQIEARALLDTGATLVVLPWHMSQQLGLHRITKRDVETPSGRHRASIFAAIVTLPDLGVAFEVEVASIIDAATGDLENRPRVLLGRSLLQHLNFCMLGPERKYTLAAPGRP